MELKEFMETLEQDRKNHRVKYFFTRLWYMLERLPRETEMLYQRITKGYCDDDVFGLGFYIINKLYHPLVAFVRYQETQGKGLPQKFATDPAAWLIVLSKIEYAVTVAWKRENKDGYDELKDKTKEQIDEHYKVIKEGFALLGEHMMDLWD